MTTESRAREFHPRFETAVARVQYIADLMATMRWERGGTGYELAEDWQLSQSTVDTYAVEAKRHLELIGQREAWLQIIQLEAHRRLGTAEDRDFASIARLAVDTVGGFTQKQELTVQQAHSPAEIADGVMAWLEEHAPERVLEAADRIRSSRALLTEGTET